MKATERAGSGNVSLMGDDWRWKPCRLWTGATNAGGYGVMRYKGRLELVHRVAFVLEYGPLPRSKPYVLHRCDNPTCREPLHLKAGTQSENMAQWAATRRRAS